MLCAKSDKMTHDAALECHMVTAKASNVSHDLLSSLYTYCHKCTNLVRGVGLRIVQHIVSDG